MLLYFKKYVLENIINDERSWDNIRTWKMPKKKKSQNVKRKYFGYFILKIE